MRKHTTNCVLFGLMLACSSCRALSTSSSLRSSGSSGSGIDGRSDNDGGPLRVVVITGTTRTEGPPRPILGPRVSRFICDHVERRGDTEVLQVLDPLELDLPLLRKPEFAYARSRVPPELQQIQETLAAADAYIAITPEYNHAPSPALLNLLNHFGSSTFSYKPSAIVSYSAGQWGGTRAAHALRPTLSELGCLPSTLR